MKLLYTLFNTKDLENHTLFSGTYPYMPNKGVPHPHPPRECMLLVGIYAVVEHMESVVE